jgi:hypothetical protein
VCVHLARYRGKGKEGEAAVGAALPGDEDASGPRADRAARRAQLVGRIREANAETLDRLADL